MSEQYYYPAAEDFRIGYEYEQRDPDYQGQCDGNEWKKGGNGIAEIEEVFNCWRHYQEYRVPYLTTEQIEAEGWIQQLDENVYYKGNNSLSGRRLFFEPILHTIEIEKIVMDDTTTIYKGYCRCINDFRLICKLLNINK